MTKEPGNNYVPFTRAVLVFSCMLAIAQPLIAWQSTQPYPPPSRSTQTPTRSSASPGGMSSRTTAPGALGMENSRRDESVDIATRLLRRRVAAELNEDFDGLRRINRDKLIPLSSSSAINYSELSQAVREINKRAKRIRSNTPFPIKSKSAEPSKYHSDPAGLAAMLKDLSRLIDEFLAGSDLRVTAANDEQGPAAGTNLEGIIRLSDAINKMAKRLAVNRTAKPGATEQTGTNRGGGPT